MINGVSNFFTVLAGGDYPEEVDNTDQVQEQKDDVNTEHDEAVCVDPTCQNRANGEFDQAVDETSQAHDENSCTDLACQTRQQGTTGGYASFWSMFSGGGQYCVPVNNEFTSHADEMRADSPLKRSNSALDTVYEMPGVYVVGDSTTDENN